MARGQSKRSQTRRKETCPEYQAEVSKAVAYLQSLPPNKLNYSAAAAIYGVNCSTLRNRYLKLRVSRRDAHEKQKLLTAAREEVLLDWIDHHADEGRPWSRERIRLKVKQLTGHRPSLDWVTAFKKRHAEALKFCGTSGLDPKRAQSFNPTTIADHFQKLGAAFNEHRYKLWNIYNFDETGMQMGGGRKSTGKKYFIPRRSRSKYKKRDANLELITVVECAAADGTMLDPGFIFQGGNTYDVDWFRNHPGISVGLTDNGWTDDYQCHEWFKQVFIPQATERRAKYGSPDDPILLIFDGHGSHLTDELREEALKHNIHFFKLPAHTTHKTQVCDVGCFGPLSKKWIERMETIVEETGEGIRRHEFVDEYMGVREASITEESVLAAYRKTGISPFNPDIFTKEDFAPSQTTSTQAHMPSTFPRLADPVEATSPSQPAATGPSSSTVPIDPALLSLDDRITSNVPDDVMDISTSLSDSGTHHDDDKPASAMNIEVEDHMNIDMSSPVSPYQQDENEAANSAEFRADVNMEVNTQLPDSPSLQDDSCAVGPDGELLNESRIQWYNDPDDSSPIPSVSDNTSPSPITRAATPIREAPSELAPALPTSTPPENAPASVGPQASVSPPAPSGPSAPHPIDTWGPKMPEHKRTRVDKRCSVAERLSAAEEDACRFETLYLAEFSRRQKLEVHCGLAMQEIQKLKTQVNRKNEKSEGRKGKQFHSEAQFMMSGEAIAQWEASKKEKVQKEKAEQEKQTLKAAAEKETAKRRTHLAQDGEVRYRGNLKSKRKSELEDIVFLLELNITGTIAQLVESILNELTTKPALKKDPRFTGLYSNVKSQVGSVQDCGPTPQDATPVSPPQDELPSEAMVPTPSFAHNVNPLPTLAQPPSPRPRPRPRPLFQQRSSSGSLLRANDENIPPNIAGPSSVPSPLYSQSRDPLRTSVMGNTFHSHHNHATPFQQPHNGSSFTYPYYNDPKFTHLAYTPHS